MKGILLIIHRTNFLDRYGFFPKVDRTIPLSDCTLGQGSEVDRMLKQQCLKDEAGNLPIIGVMVRQDMSCIQVYPSVIELSQA